MSDSVDASVGGTVSCPRVAVAEVVANNRLDDTNLEKANIVTNSQDKLTNSQDKITNNQDKITNNQDKITNSQDKLTNLTNNNSLPKEVSSDELELLKKLEEANR